MRFLVTSIGTATAVNLVKALRKLEYQVVGVDINDYGYTAGSQLVNVYYKVPLAKSEQYLDVLCDIVENNCIDVLIPINDIEVNIISANRNRFSCKCIVPDLEILREVSDKLLCAQRMREIGIEIPQILNIDNIEIHRILRDRIGVGSKGILYLEPGANCPQYAREKSFLQKRVDGEEYTVDVLASANGAPLYIVPRKRLEVKSGVATKVLIEENVELIESVSRIYDHINIPGFSNVQFIRDMDNHNWFIEINPRFSGCGAATLATCPTFIEDYIKIVNGEGIKQALNRNVAWNSIVTRYYEEMVYHG